MSDGAPKWLTSTCENVSTVEKTARRAYGGNNNVAVIRLADGKEYTVCDDARRVATDIWLGKSIPNDGK